MFLFQTTVRDRHGNTALHLACINNQKDCVKQLLTPLNGAEQNQTPGTDKFPQDLELWNYDGKSQTHFKRCIIMKEFFTRLNGCEKYLPRPFYNNHLSLVILV